MDFADLRKEFVGVQFGEAVVGVNPGNEFGESDAEGVVYWAVDSGGHDFLLVLEARPASSLPFQDIDLQPGAHRNFDGGAGDLSITHGGVSIAEIQKSALDVHGQIERVACAGFRCFHVAAEFRGNDGATGFAARWSYADAAEKRMQRNFYFVA